MHGRLHSRPAASPLKRIDCVNTVLTRRTDCGTDELLLVWNADWRTPSWSLPGGAREAAESLTEAAIREVREETGLDVEIGPLLEVHEKIGLGGRLHLVLFTFCGTMVGGDLICDGRAEPDGGGVSAVQWFSFADARAFPTVARILDLALPRNDGARCTCDRRSHAGPHIPTSRSA